MRTTVLDIETGLSEPWTEVGADGKRTFPPLPLHVPEIVCWLVADSGRLELHHWDRATEAEPTGLERIASTLRGSDRLVTWNGRGFDMPLLGLRAMLCGVDWSFWESRRHRFPNYKTPLYHYDLPDQLSDYGSPRGLGLDRVARLVGLPGKVGIDGSEVDAALKRGERERVRAYCSNDVFETYVVYLLWSASHGGATAAPAAVTSARAWAASHPVLGQFYAERPAC